MKRRESDVRKLAKMDALDPVPIVREIIRLWDHGYGSARWRGGYLRLATGGWSENEYVLRHLPRMFRFCYWEFSKRGGLEVFRIPRKLRRELEAGRP